MGAPMKVAVELVAARILGDDIGYALHGAPCERARDPDTAARAMLAAQFPAVWLRKVILHSTGWRFEHGRIVLTYLAYSDGFASAQLPLRIPIEALPAARDGPAGIAAQAVREVARLARDEPRRVRRALRESTVAVLVALAPADAPGIDASAAS